MQQLHSLQPAVHSQRMSLYHQHEHAISQCVSFFYARRFAFYAGARLPSAHPYQGAAFALAGQSINASNALSLTRTMRRLMGFQGSRPTCPHPGHLCVPQTSVV